MADATIIDGRALAGKVKDDLTRRVTALQRQGKNVRLDAVLVGGDQGARMYANNQAKACGAVGIEYVLHELPDTSSESDIIATVDMLNESKVVTEYSRRNPERMTVFRLFRSPASKSSRIGFRSVLHQLQRVCVHRCSL